MFFPLKFRATILRSQRTRDEAGQVVNSWATVATDVKCLFLEMSGNKVVGPQEGYNGVFAFYVEPSTDIDEGDRVVDILSIDGSVIEAGPLKVESVKKVGSHISGRVHHISCKLKGESQ